MALFSLISFFVMQISLYTMCSSHSHEKHQEAGEAIHIDEPHPHEHEHQENAEEIHIDEKHYLSQQQFDTEKDAIAAIKENFSLDGKTYLIHFEEIPKLQISKYIFDGEESDELAKEVIGCAQKLEETPKHAGDREEGKTKDNLKTKFKNVGGVIKHKGEKISEKMDEMDNYITIKLIKVGQKYQLVAHYISYPAGGLFGTIGLVAGGAYGCMKCGVHKMVNVCLKREKYHGKFVEYLEYYGLSGAIHGFMGAQGVFENFLTYNNPSKRGKNFEEVLLNMIKDAKVIKKSSGIYTEKSEKKNHNVAE